MSQLDLAQGRLSITGLDLLRRNVAFEHENGDPLDMRELVGAFEEANRSAISLEALEGREENASFLREYIENRLQDGSQVEAAVSGAERPLKVLMLVVGSMWFEDDSDLSAVRLEGDCDCRVFHLRLVQNPRDGEGRDLFDEVDDLVESFDPPTFDIVTPRDLRRTIGEIVEELSRF